MNKIFKLFSILSLVALVFAACTPEEYQLQAPLAKSAVKFSVTKSDQNPNVFYLKSETPGAQPYWQTPVGTSIKLNDTIDIAFAGDYTITYTVETPGGLVTADPYAFTVTTVDKGFVSDSMWTYLTGGIDHSKTWVLDCDASGKSKYFAGPIYFGGTGWEWPADLASNPWITTPADFGTMTFDLKGKPNFSSDNKAFPQFSGTGTFMLYPDKKELKTYGAEVIHDNTQAPRARAWNTLTVKSISANEMQLIAYIDNGSWLIYNYITLDYYNSH